MIKQWKVVDGRPDWIDTGANFVDCKGDEKTAALIVELMNKYLRAQAGLAP